MKKIECGEVTVAIMATPKSPVGETGGGEVFSGTLANALAGQGFPVRIYGQENPQGDIAESVTYMETSPTTDEIMARDKVCLRKAINETGVAAPLRLSMDIAKTSNRNWVVIDNDTISAPLAPLIAQNIPHIFVQHSNMTPHTYTIYERARASGAKVIAIADYQRETVAAHFGTLHDATIKNGIDVRKLSQQTVPYQWGEPIRVGTLSRIETTDIKGIRFAAMAVEKLRAMHPASLTIAGPVQDRSVYDALVGPCLNAHTTYVGEKRGNDKAAYISDLHVGAALSNPGDWDDRRGDFGSWFAEGNSLALHEMIYSGTVPVSTDSGGAEPMVDAGLENFVVPLDIIQTEGLDAFICLAAQRMLEAAYYSIALPELRSRVRTTEDVGRDYGEYILSLLGSQ